MKPRIAISTSTVTKSLVVVGYRSSIIIGVALFVLWRAPLALVVILAAWHQVLGAVLLLVILGVVALRGRMTGRPF
jgi:hypothetical protein